MNKGRSLRASDDDREKIVSRLHAAATEGRIASDELEQRVSAALKARTYGDLDATVADLPAPRGTRHPSRRRSTAGWAVSTIRAYPLLLLFAIPAVAVTAALMIAVAVVWVVVMAAAMVLGGRPRPPLTPGLYNRNRRLYAPPARGSHAHARSFWA
ncbi:MAG: DUF1707 domain-containing protein [Solirubrobacteraceae bacterium]